MNSWVHQAIEIKNTTKKGTGYFAKVPIEKNEIIIIQAGKIMKYDSIEEGEYAPFADHCFQVDRDILICPMEPNRKKLDGIFQVNHSCNPNCGFRGQIVLIAMRDIKTGEEITYDYAMTDANYDQVECTKMECFCGAENCRKLVTGEDWKKKGLQQRYKGFFSAFIQQMIEQNST